VELRAPLKQRKHLVIDAGRAAGAFPIDARELTRIAEDGDQGLDAIGLVERFARRRNMPRVAFVQGHFHAAGHRGPMHADEPIDRCRRPIEIQRKQRAPRNRHGPAPG
jgi:hypothetical protein